MKRFLAFLIILPFLALPAAAATFEYDIEITSISGDGKAMNVGFFSTGSVGDAGTGRAVIDDSFPGDYPFTLEVSQFQAIFPGVATAGTFFVKNVVHDTVAGTLTVDGFLGGVTGPYALDLSAGMYQFVYTGTAGGPVINSNTGLNNFLAGATMAGWFEGTFFNPGEFTNGYHQRIDFQAVTNVVPLPAGAVLLLTALGMGAVTRRRG